MPPIDAVSHTYLFMPYSWALMLASAIALIVAFVLWQRRDTPGVLYLVLLELAVAEWTLTIAFESASTTIPLKILWSQIAYPGTAAAPLFYFLFALAYSQNDRYLTRRNLVILSIVPIVTVLMAVTNEWHGWLWADISIKPGSHLALYGHGPWFWVFVGYTYCLLSVGVLLIWLAIFRYPAFYRSQVGALVLSSIFPIAGNIVYVFELNPIPGIDWTAVGFLLSGCVLAFGIFRLRIFDLVPLARNRLVDTMRDAVLVIDGRDRIVDVNPAMQTLIGKPPDRVIGRPASEALEFWAMLTNSFQNGADTPPEIGLKNGHTTSYYDLQVSLLRDRRGRLNGRLIVLRDITQRKSLEADRVRLIEGLQNALAQVKTLTGMLPICASCKKIRDDKGYWHSVEAYVRDRSDAEFSHGICPDCMKKLYPEYIDLPLDEEPGANPPPK